MLGPALADDGADGDAARARLGGERLAAPELATLEVLSTIRRAVRADRLGERRAGQAVRDLIEIPIQLAPHGPLLLRVWELRESLTSYDASYVALAEMLEAPLLTADRAIQQAPGTRCEIEVLAAE